MPSGGDDQSQGNAPGNSGGGGGGRGSSSSSSGGGGGGYAGDGGGYGSSATGGGGSPGGSGGGGSFGDGGGAAPAGGRGTPAPSTGGYTPSAVAGLAGYVGANDTGYFSGTSGSAGNTVGGLASAYGDMGRSMASVGIGGLGGRSSVASSYSAPSQYSGLAAAYSSMRGEDYTSPAVSTMPSFESLTRSMNAPAKGLAPPGVAPSYAGVMAFDAAPPSNMASSVPSRSVATTFASGANLPSMYGTKSAPSSWSKNSTDVVGGVIAAADALGISAEDLLAVMSYETRGTMNPTIKGPTTQWGQHRGFIQFGEEQAKEHNVDWAHPIGSQLGPKGAVVSYLSKAGVVPGTNMMDLYSAVNAGRVGRYNASDAKNGGAKGTVADKVNNQMGEHRAAAKAALAAYQSPSTPSSIQSSRTGLTSFANTPAVGPTVSESRNMAVVADRMATEKADKVAASQEFASRYLGETYGDRTKGNAGVKSSTTTTKTATQEFVETYLSPPAKNAITDLEDRPLSKVISVGVYNPAAKRSEMPTTGIVQDVQLAVSRNFGPEYSVGVYSGKEPKGVAAVGSAFNHPTGRAVDFDVIGPNGKAVDISNPDIAGKMSSMHNDLAARGHPIGYGPGYMAPGRTHAGGPKGTSAIGWGRTGKAASMEPSLYAELSASRAAGISVPTPTSRGQMSVAAAPTSVSTPASPVSSYAPQPSITGPGSAAPSSRGISVASAPSPAPTSTTSAPAPGETLAAQVSQEAATTTPETAPSEAKGLGVAGRWGARAIDIGTAAIPGVGTVVGVVNGVLSLTGNKSVGTMVMEGFVNGERGEYTGTSGLEGDPYMPEPVETQETNIDATPAQAVASFTDKYIYPEKKYPTPEEKWGRSSIG